jgi:hypothetical protein
MNKRPLTIMTHLLRSASFLVLLFVAITMIRLAQGQPPNSKNSQVNSETLRNGLRNTTGAKTIVKPVSA